jgi:acid phosphatase type 7
MKILIATICLLSSLSISAAVIPYLQNLTPNSISINWQTKQLGVPILRWGVHPEAMSERVTPQIIKIPKVEEELLGGRKLYRVTLRNLLPDTRYYYKIEDKTGLLTFKTAPSIPRNFAFLVMSDAQHGNVVTNKAIKESVMKHAFYSYPDQLNFPMEFTLFAGDLVQKGPKYRLWKKQFFEPMSPLLHMIPIFPVIGNHEENTPIYFSFFDLPNNGTPGKEEHWYYFDYGSVRVIGLDTNVGYRNCDQTDWLAKTLNQTAANPKIDFVVVQFHHPYQSELWLNGNTAYSGKIERMLEEFAAKTGRPTVYFCGHTHGYSRGHSLKANSSMFVVGSIGGAVDDWGDYEQKDYPKYLKTFAQFGWMMVQVSTGDNPQMRIKRYSYGNDYVQRDNGVVDEFVVKRYNRPPQRPTIIAPVGKGLQRKMREIHFKATPFVDPDGDEHMSTQIQVSLKADDFGQTLADVIVNYENWYKDEDRNSGVELSNLKFELEMLPYTMHYWRVRYRDKSLAWSEWSEVGSFGAY